MLFPIFSRTSIRSNMVLVTGSVGRLPTHTVFDPIWARIARDGSVLGLLSRRLEADRTNYISKLDSMVVSTVANAATLSAGRSFGAFISGLPLDITSCSKVRALTLPVVITLTLVACKPTTTTETVRRSCMGWRTQTRRGLGHFAIIRPCCSLTRTW